MKISFILGVFLIGLLGSSPLFASVYEFNSDGSVSIYEANDDFAVQRHKKHRNFSPELVSASFKDKNFSDLISKAANKYHVSENLIHAVIHTESAYNPNAISEKGAAGLMQLMPGTARQYGVSDVFSPKENIYGGTRYLKFLLGKYHGDTSLAVAAYNAGEGAVDRYGDIPPFEETRKYVEKISVFLEGENK